MIAKQNTNDLALSQIENIGKCKELADEDDIQSQSVNLKFKENGRQTREVSIVNRLANNRNQTNQALKENTPSRIFKQRIVIYDSSKLSFIKQGPKKSSEWSINKDTNQLKQA